MYTEEIKSGDGFGDQRYSKDGKTRSRSLGRRVMIKPANLGDYCRAGGFNYYIILYILAGAHESLSLA